jgi:hypothetical protein
MAPYFQMCIGIDRSFSRVLAARRRSTRDVSAFARNLRDPLKTQSKLSLKPLKFDSASTKNFDFVVGNIHFPPVSPSKSDVVSAMNVIDAMSRPSRLPMLQRRLLKKGGTMLTASPLVWNAPVLTALEKKSLKKTDGSLARVRSLYERAGFKIHEEHPDVPWLRMTHWRLMNIYSVHCLWGTVGDPLESN